MTKVEIEFATDYEYNRPISKHIGRLYIGDHCMRLYFTPEGKVKASIPQAAVDDGSLVLRDHLADPLGFPV